MDTKLDKSIPQLGNAKLVFLMGTQRSGTTLLTRALSSHEDIFVQNEISVHKVFSENQKSQIIDNISEQIKVRHGRTLMDFVADGKKIVGVKDPQLTEYISQLEQFLPEAKFVVIVRDARGVVASYIDNKWGLGTNAYTGALRWKTEVEQQLSFMARHPDNFLLIRFEDLVQDMEKELRKVCDFVEIAFHSEMLDYHGKKAQFKANKSNINTNQKPNAEISKKWKSKLSEKEISIIDSVANVTLEKLHYSVDSQPIKLSNLEVFWYKLHQMVLGELQIQYQLKRVWLKNKLARFGSSK